MGRIAVLDSLTADQIAAGEVVERPASVIKELIENSLDAGATRIRLEVETGGIARIGVRDNGAGISADQVALAFERHATSKMVRLDDLERITTHGFRGEALPAIASVSRVAMRTRTEDELAGTLLRIEAGEIIERREEGCPKGTEVEVSDLFFNTPARRKFMKRESTEAAHAGEALLRLAVWRPDVAFTMTSGGRTVRELPRVERIEERVANLFGGETLVRAEGSEGGVGVLAILGPPERARAGAGSLYTYVNGRFVRDKTLLRAVTQAFGGTLEPGRYPAGLIALTLPGGSFDVNVHPQKTEIRFSDPAAVFRAASRVIGEMVRAAPFALGAPGASSVFEQPAPPPPVPHRPYGRLIPPPARPEPLEPKGGAPPPRPLDGATPDLFPSSRVEQADARTAEPDGRTAFSGLVYIGQAQGLFLLLESDRDLVIIDQHAAHERITYERLRRQLAEGRIASQPLLMPHAVDFGPAEAERVAGLSQDLCRLGLEVERSGPDRVAIRAVPAELSGASPDRLLADLVLALEQGRSGSRGDSEERALAAMACHGSLRSGVSVDRAEVEALLRQMDAVDFAGHCPHGRPVVARIPWQEIRRRVGRA